MIGFIRETAAIILGGRPDPPCTGEPIHHATPDPDRHTGDDGKPYGISLTDWDAQVRAQLAHNRQVAEAAGLITESWILSQLAELTTVHGPLKAAQLMFGGS